LRKIKMKRLIFVIVSTMLAASSWAKIPAPVLSDEAKAKAAEATAKTAHGNKVADFQLCKSREKTAAHFYKTAQAAGKATKPPTDTPACADPGAFVFPLPVAAPAAGASAAAPNTAAAPAAPAAPVAPAATPAKKI
jgi:hypothetical protein